MVDINELQTQADTAVAEATSEDAFDVLDYFEGATLPTASATLYRDTEAGYRLAELKEQKAARDETDDDEGLGIADEDNWVDEEEIEELQHRLKASAVTFKLQALAPAARTALEKKVRATTNFKQGEDNPEYVEAYNANLIAKSIQSVTDVKGRKDTKPWTAERVLAFADKLEMSEWMKLFEAVFKINFIGDAIDQAVSADFS